MADLQQQPDDLYPNDGANLGGVPKEPPEQDVERKKEKAQTLEALPILKAIVERLEERIAFYQSVDSIPASVKSEPVKFMNMHNSNELTRDNLKNEKEYIQSLIDQHAKNK